MKYIIYKGTGGLVHLLNGLQQAIIIAKKEKRILLIDTILTGAFKHSFNDFFHIYDDELHYICSYDQITDKNNLFFGNLHIDEIQTKGTRLIEGKYYLADTKIYIQENKNMENELLRVYGGYAPEFIRHLKLNQNIIEMVYQNTSPLLDEHKEYASLHFRNTDMKNDIQLFVQKIKKVHKEKKISYFFIATDNHKAFDEFKKKCPNIKFFRIFNVPNCQGKNIHYHHPDKKEIILNTFYDLYMIGKSKYFIPSMNSGFSKWIIFQRDHEKHNIFDEKFYFKVV